MKFYNSVGPNPRMVRMFMAEKGIDIPKVEVDLLAGDNRKEPYLKVNPAGQMPALELDDGTRISETVSICRYFEEMRPEPPLFGRSAVEKALVDQWIRRIEFQVMAPVSNFWRHAHPRTAALLTQYKDFGESNREAYSRALTWLDGELAGKAFIAGTDIAQFTTFTSGEDGIAYEEKMERYLAALEALPMPTLAVIEGFAIGGGLAIAACCDLRIATPGSRR